MVGLEGLQPIYHYWIHRAPPKLLLQFFGMDALRIEAKIVYRWKAHPKNYPGSANIYMNEM